MSGTDATYQQVRAALAGEDAVPHPATRVPVAACVLWRVRKPEIEVFLVRRSPDTSFLGGHWCFPAVRIESWDENPCAAAVRGAFEQTGERVQPAESPMGSVRWTTPMFSAAFDVTTFFAELREDARPAVPQKNREVTEGTWLTPAAAMEAWRSGRWLIPPPALRILEVLGGAISEAGAALAETLGTELDASRTWELAAGIRVCPVRTPTLPPATHTNCYIVGSRELVVVDPGSPYADEQTELARAVDQATAHGGHVREIWLTHHHGDHVGGAAVLADTLGVPIAAHPETARRLRGQLSVSRELADAEVAVLSGDPVRRLRCVFTPGHAPGHHCFMEETTGFVIAGDMIAGIGTILIDPGEGDMALYLDSLRRVAQLESTCLLPAHGGPILDCRERVEALIAHRLQRESAIARALAARGSASTEDLVTEVYRDVPSALHPLAARSLIAHLNKLVSEARAAGDDPSGWESRETPP